MTRRDFIAVAADFRDELIRATPEQRSVLYAVALNPCATFHAGNARFRPGAVPGRLRILILPLMLT